MLLCKPRDQCPTHSWTLCCELGINSVAGTCPYNCIVHWWLNVPILSTATRPCLLDSSPWFIIVFNTASGCNLWELPAFENWLLFERVGVRSPLVISTPTNFVLSGSRVDVLNAAKDNPYVLQNVFVSSFQLRDSLNFNRHWLDLLDVSSHLYNDRTRNSIRPLGSS